MHLGWGLVCSLCTEVTALWSCIEVLPSYLLISLKLALTAVSQPDCLDGQSQAGKGFSQSAPCQVLTEA